VRPCGWDESSSARPEQVCVHLGREWARSVCDDPWAAVRQALPANSFELVDLRRLRVGFRQGDAHCIDDGKPLRLPDTPGAAAMVCKANVSGARDDEFHVAVVRVDSDLGALWTVWRGGQSGEPAEAMTRREAQAIIAFVQHGLGAREDFERLHATLCRLRAPGSTDSAKGPDCTNP
jgi:hypothetical protein